MTADSEPAEAPEAAQGFRVRLSNFEGPFDLLLQLIFGHRLDVTEVALHQVTDEFIAYTKEIGRQLELDETTAFIRGALAANETNVVLVSAAVIGGGARAAALTRA